MKKLCSRCKTEHPLAKFAPQKGGLHGVTGRCVACRTIASRESTWKKQGVDLSWDEYLEMVGQHRNRCAICDGPPNSWHGRLVMDHDHETGRVRGLLCHSCNVGIGLLREEPRILAAAIQYLER